MVCGLVAVLGAWLPLAPGAHAVAKGWGEAAGAHDGAARNGDATGCCDEGGGESERNGPRPGHGHDESGCSVCVQLGLAKRADVATADSAGGWERAPRAAGVIAHADERALGRRHRRHGDARGPPLLRART